jgi:hypothetical protein
LINIRDLVAGLEVAWQGNPAEEEAARVTFKSWLKDMNDLLAKGGCVPEPKEADMPEYKPPDDLSDVKGARGGRGGRLLITGGAVVESLCMRCKDLFTWNCTALCCVTGQPAVAGRSVESRDAFALSKYS